MKGLILKYILWTLVCSFIFASVLVAFLSYLRMPEVHVSYTTNKCVRIIDYKGKEHNCSELKNYSKYEKVWVN